MYVSAEIITIIASAVGVLAVLGGGFAWFLNRIDVRFDASEKRMDERFDRVDGRMDRLEGRMDRLEGRMDRLQDDMRELGRELTEVKIAVARFEGPPPRLMSAR